MNEFISNDNFYREVHKTPKNQKEMVPAAVLEYALNDFLTSRKALTRTTDFIYAVDVTREEICYADRMNEFLGWAPDMIHLAKAKQYLHPNERDAVIRLHQQLSVLIKKHDIISGECACTIAHRIKKDNGTYNKILNCLIPVLVSAEGNLLLYAGLCTDITDHVFSEDVTISFSFSNDAPQSKGVILARLQEFSMGKRNRFTAREMEVLKMWSEMPSVELAAEYLQISDRTFTTHLRNMRKKIGARRTVDVLLYAKERGWV